jgi:hypothetical protein
MNSATYGGEVSRFGVSATETATEIHQEFRAIAAVTR